MLAVVLTRKPHTYVSAWAFVLLLAAATAHGNSAERIPAELRSCISLERNTERLACFDRGIAALIDASPAAMPSAETSFGLLASAPAPQAVAAAESREELKSLRARVTALEGGDGAQVLSLDNGQTWQQLSGGLLLLKVGDEVTIHRAALGSFQMLVPSGRNGKVKRLR